MISKCCWMAQLRGEIELSQAGTERGCQVASADCRGSWVHIKGLFKKPLFVHPAGGLWGTGDEGPIKGHVLPF